MVNEEHIPPLERTLAVLGRMHGDLISVKDTVEKMGNKFDRFSEESRDTNRRQDSRIQTLEADKAQRDRRSALIGAGGGLGGMGFVIAMWQVLESVWRSVR